MRRQKLKFKNGNISQNNNNNSVDCCYFQLLFLHEMLRFLLEIVSLTLDIIYLRDFTHAAYSNLDISINNGEFGGISGLNS